jgi:hypothetical protein
MLNDIYVQCCPFVMSVIMLNIVMLSVVMLSVVAPTKELFTAAIVTLSLVHKHTRCGRENFAERCYFNIRFSISSNCQAAGNGNLS